MKHVIRTTLTFVVLASLAMTATANSTGKSKSRKTHAPAQQEVALGVPDKSGEIAPMVGTWTLRDAGKPRLDIKMIFRSNGTFAFAGPNWKSAGTFRLQDHRLALEWTSVDGARVQPGAMKKAFAMGEGDSSFRIDTYTYYKLDK